MQEALFKLCGNKKFTFFEVDLITESFFIPLLARPLARNPYWSGLISVRSALACLIMKGQRVSLHVSRQETRPVAANVPTSHYMNITMALSLL